MRSAYRLALLPVLLVLAAHVQATTYSVKGSGGDYSSIQACASAASAGDTCVVYAGSYSGWTQSKSGTPGNPITIIANTGDTVTVNGGIDVSGASYIVISHLALTGGGVSGSPNTNHVTVTYCRSQNATLFHIPDSQGSTGSDNVLSYNTITYSTPIQGQGFYVFGDRNRFEYNEISGAGDDCFDLGGNNVVVRGNYCHDANGAQTGQHIDFIQVQPFTPQLTNSLIEGNREIHCYNDNGNCHFIILRGNSSPLIDGNIIRFNFAQNLNGSGITNGGSGSDWATNTIMYNNTIAVEGNGGGGMGAAISCWGQGAGGTQGVMIVNNISYNTGDNGQSPWACDSGNGLVLASGNLSYNSGYSGSWNAPYSAEATYSALESKNPLFANYPTDGTLQSNSPARNAGAALTTTNGSGSASATLVVADAHPFQPGWTGVRADCIRVGASATTCITAVNYSTNTITVSPAISWSSGQGVYLYSKSDGLQVLTGANPDVGAFPYGAAGAPQPPPPPSSAKPNPPTGLTATVN